MKLTIFIPEWAKGLTLVDGVIVPSQNRDDHGSIRVMSEPVLVRRKDSKYVTESIRYSSIIASIKTLQSIVKRCGFQVGTDISETPWGNSTIVVKERFEPWFEGQKPKTAGEGGDILLKDGQPIYRNTFVVDEGSDSDETITHNGTVDQATFSASQAVHEDEAIGAKK